jgi:hypothetical protein
MWALSGFTGADASSDQFHLRRAVVTQGTSEQTDCVVAAERFSAAVRHLQHDRLVEGKIHFKRFQAPNELVWLHRCCLDSSSSPRRSSSASNLGT